jgi:Holliday junction resolvase
MKQYKKRRDNNENEIVRALRAAGRSVIADNGTIDLIVGNKGKTFLLEVKNPERTLSKKTGLVRESELTDAQRELLQTWEGGPLNIVTSAEEALSVTEV